MSDETKEPDILARASAALTQRTRVRLDKITFDTERYCHRDPEALKPKSLESLMDSLTLEGLQVPVEGYFDEHSNFILLKGHRRVTGCRILAGKNVPGFTLDMEVEAIEVLEGSTPADRLIRSISDNEVRLNLDRVERIRVVKKLHEAGVQEERAARAMNFSVKTYQRDLLIAKHGWMFQHLIDQSISPTHAFSLLDVAEKAGRLLEMREDLDAWIAGKKQKIREDEKLTKAREGKELSTADKQVKKKLSNLMVAHWVELLRDKKRFDEDAQWNFAAGIKAETEQLHISSVNLDLSKAPLDKLAKVAGKLSLVTKQLVPYLKKAQEKESGVTGHDAAESPYDLEFLRELGLEEKAKELEAQTKLANVPDGEETPQEQPAEREEEDLTQEVELPAPPAPTPPPVTPPVVSPAKKATNGKEAKK